MANSTDGPAQASGTCGDVRFVKQCALCGLFHSGSCATQWLTPPDGVPMQMMSIPIPSNAMTFVIADANSVEALRTRIDRLEKALATVWSLLEASNPKAVAAARRAAGQ